VGVGVNVGGGVGETGLLVSVEAPTGGTAVGISVGGASS